ncbi:hypothetical protein HNQ90_000027 [Algibacter amylolyticus]|nr:hypothetical protein [Algibacter amylolyticus]
MFKDITSNELHLKIIYFKTHKMYAIVTYNVKVASLLNVFS